ncbi:hypothetical protein GpartN1_g5357.t1 [Galdieria partita]|uniref:Protein phosphatase inhibitor 2 n=1 Tax=Galdieria partita TaxID=83374 RepID=A0A9C7PZR1_9RHOD|nr:hypothetical protein GpartN1_g5357.t1 [Galdieria partita]
MSRDHHPNKPSNTSNSGGILKNSDNIESAEKPSSDKKKRVRLHWDEENLQRNETEREPRMTITEPKTPYQLSDRSDSDSEASTDRCPVLHSQPARDWRLEAALSDTGNFPHSSEDGGGYSSNSSQSTPRSRSSREEFERKRKFHYDEFRISKYFRERGELCVDQGSSNGEEEINSEEEGSSPPSSSRLHSNKSAIESEPVSPENS